RIGLTGDVEQPRLRVSVLGILLERPEIELARGGALPLLAQRRRESQHGIQVTAVGSERQPIEALRVVEPTLLEGLVGIGDIAVDRDDVCGPCLADAFGLCGRPGGLPRRCRTTPRRYARRSGTRGLGGQGDILVARGSRRWRIGNRSGGRGGGA